MKKVLFPILALILALGLGLPMATPVLAEDPVPVTLWFSGTIEYHDGAEWQTFTKPTMSLAPGPCTFRFSDGTHPYAEAVIDVSAPSIKKNIAYLQLKDHTGAGLAGGTARGGYGSSYSAWYVSGATDANGVLLDLRDVSTQPTTMSYEMRFNNTTQVKTQDVSVNSFFDFQTILLTLRLETCSGTPLNGGRAKYGIGSTYTSWWFPGGLTGSSAPGEAAAEFFPGTYSFEMTYKLTADQKVSVEISNENNMLTWKTTKVTLYYSGLISYGGTIGDSTWFTKPSMELLPGTYWFHFRDAGYTQLTFSGCSFENAVSQSAWGEGDRFVEKGNWAMYFTDSPTDLLLEDGTLIGTVTVASNGNDGLLVTYTITAAEVFLSQIHFHAAANADTLKSQVTNRAGNPMPGQFEHKFSFEWGPSHPGATFSFTIDNDSMSTFAAHAKVWVADVP